jgi:hypothetical protein
MVASALLLGACTTQATPATAPATSQLATTTIAVSEPTTATTTTSAPTTTVDRTTEIEAIFQDLEQRRLTALYEDDREAFAALFANDAYLERSLESFDQVRFEKAPTTVDLKVSEVLVDNDLCIAAQVATDYSSLLVGGQTTTSEFVLERGNHSWAYSFIGEGWRCNGPHPLES